MIAMREIIRDIGSPGAEEPESMVSFCILIIMGPAEECLAKKAAKGQNHG